jgi:hypothetical protein
VKQLREAIPPGPSYEAVQKYLQPYEKSPRGPDVTFSTKRGIDRSRKMFYKVIGRPERLVSSDDGTYLLYYKYRHGKVQFEVNTTMFDNDCVRFFPGQVSFY